MLAHLHTYIETIANPLEPMSACAILNETHDRCETGIVILRDAFRRILKHVLHPLTRQTVYWMLYAHLQDPHEEFFIVEKSDINEKAQSLW